MAYSARVYQSGDMVTAQDFNQFTDNTEALRARLEVLEREKSAPPVSSSSALEIAGIAAAASISGRRFSRRSLLGLFRG